jgi:hypothetical protein
MSREKTATLLDKLDSLAEETVMFDTRVEEALAGLGEDRELDLLQTSPACPGSRP